MIASRLATMPLGYLVDERFPLVRELGSTEWSAAFATQLDDGRPKEAAIKIFSSRFVEPEGIAPWDIARTLSHPHLMPVFHAGHCCLGGEDLLYVVTEYAEEVLSQVLPLRPLTPAETISMLRPVLSALSYLHNFGLTHGHLRPTNIMVIDGDLKLSPDLGWRASTRSIYDPPESATAPLHPSADVWSLGILVIEALTQQHPKLIDGVPEIPENIPEPLFTICRDCLHVDPESRCTVSGIQELITIWQLEQSDEEPDPPAIAPIADPVRKASHELPILIGGSAILLVLLLVGAFELGWDLTPRFQAAATQVEAVPKTAAKTGQIKAESAPGSTDVTVTEPDAPAAIHQPSAMPRTQEQPVIADHSSPSAEVSDGNQAGSVRGAVLHEALPEIPQKILNTIHGHITVAIRVEVGPDGKVVQAYIDSSGPSRYFANQAQQAAQRWLFAPLTAAGSQARAWLLEFQYSQSGVSAKESEVTP